MIVRSPPVNGRTPCMATYAGGPQISGQDSPTGMTNVTVLRHYAEGTGDDSLALFDVVNAIVAGCYIRDSFARGILLVNTTARLTNNTLVRCPLYNVSSLIS